MNASWVTEYSSGVSQGVLPGTLVGMVLNGAYSVKQGPRDASWVTECTCTASGQLSDATQTTPLRIGVVDTSGNFYVKEGIYGSWVNQGILSGNYIGELVSGNFKMKQGSISGSSWTSEDTGVTQSYLSSMN